MIRARASSHRYHRMHDPVPSHTDTRSRLSQRNLSRVIAISQRLPARKTVRLTLPVLDEVQVSTSAFGDLSKLSLLCPVVFFLVVTQAFFQESMPQQLPRRPSSRRIDYQATFEQVQHVVDTLDMSSRFRGSWITAWRSVQGGIQGEHELAYRFRRIQRDRVQIASERSV